MTVTQAAGPSVNSGDRQQLQVGEIAATILSLGTNKLIGRGAGWLKRNGLFRYVMPLLLLNEAFGAYRAYVAGAAVGLW